MRRCVSIELLFELEKPWSGNYDYPFLVRLTGPNTKYLMANYFSSDPKVQNNHTLHQITKPRIFLVSLVDERHWSLFFGTYFGLSVTVPVAFPILEYIIRK